MTRMAIFLSRLAALLRRRSLEGELDDELRFHLEMETDENIRRGMSAEEARYAARRSFGGIEQTREAWRDRRFLPQVDAWVRDLRQGARMLARSPLFTAFAVVSLALGIGANTAIFTVLHALVLRPLPYPEPRGAHEALGNVNVGRPGLLDPGLGAEPAGLARAEQGVRRDRGFHRRWRQPGGDMARPSVSPRLALNRISSRCFV
jgi:hypothetical protein